MTIYETHIPGTWRAAAPQHAQRATHHGVLVRHISATKWTHELVTHAPPPQAQPTVAYRWAAGQWLPYSAAMLERRAAAGVDVPRWYEEAVA